MVSRCVSCGIIYLWHKNLLITYSNKEFSNFKSVMDQLYFEECSVGFPDGQERIIVRTPYKNISFSFDLREWLEFRDMIDEASYMNDVYSLLEQGSNT